jgi:alkanesulfonate monooxygenase SsuD/methylene tetrahydromethanopterin reductase-like flavin-dependent oxidoreductase (luciferase family)
VCNRLENLVGLGIGAGYQESEFEALGVPFAERNELTDEAIMAMRVAWTGESVTFTGRHFEAPGNTMLPRPARAGGPPLWIGGNSKRAIRRAVELADGWSPMPSPTRFSSRLHTPGLETLDDLRARLAYAHEHAVAVGRTDPFEVVFMPLGLDMFTNAPADPPAVVAGIELLAAAGVTYVAMTVPGETRDQMLANFARFRDDVVPAVADL